MSLFPLKTIPTSDKDRLDWIRLIRSRRVGPATFQRLMRDCGSASAALERLPEIAQEAGVKNYATCPLGVAEKEYAAANRLGATMVCFGASNYPAGLYDLPDPPAFLWAQGRIELLSCPAIAIVGARNASSAGLNMSRRLARELGEAGYGVISGLARGIDKAAHEAALESGTIAVLAGGVDVNYPSECAELTEDIRHRGLVLSEMPIGVQPQARHFPNRNRIISGIACGVVVVEGAAKSGSLITARNALDQGREVMAVPGSPLDARASGCNMLIRDGAQLVRNAADILESLGPASANDAAAATSPDVLEPESPDDALPPSPRSRAAHKLTADRLLSLIGPTPVDEDELIEETGGDPGTVVALISELEVSGRLERQPGGRITSAAPRPAQAHPSAPRPSVRRTENRHIDA